MINYTHQLNCQVYGINTNRSVTKVAYKQPMSFHLELRYRIKSTLNGQGTLELSLRNIALHTSSSRSFLKHRHAARFLKPSPSYVRVWLGLNFIMQSAPTFTNLGAHDRLQRKRERYNHSSQGLSGEARNGICMRKRSKAEMKQPNNAILFVYLPIHSRQIRCSIHFSKIANKPIASLHGRQLWGSPVYSLG